MSRILFFIFARCEPLNRRLGHPNAVGFLHIPFIYCHRQVTLQEFSITISRHHHSRAFCACSSSLKPSLIQKKKCLIFSVESSSLMMQSVNQMFTCYNQGWITVPSSLNKQECVRSIYASEWQNANSNKVFGDVDEVSNLCLLLSRHAEFNNKIYQICYKKQP